MPVKEVTPPLAVIAGLAYHLPEATLSNEELAAEFPSWTAQKIEEKTGISYRHIAGEAECSSDLAVAAAGKLFRSGTCRPADIDYVLFCTQSADYLLPTTACIIQSRLGIPKSSGAIDFNQGCSGFVVGLGIAKGLIETGQARNVLLLTAETYSKFIHKRDKSVRTLFGDAAAATLISIKNGNGDAYIGPFVYGTDGEGANNLIVPTGGMRHPRTSDSAVEREWEDGNIRSKDNLYMSGAEIFTFALRTIPPCMNLLLERSALSVEEVDLFVFHQANRYMIDHLRKKLALPEEKVFIGMKHCGNTVSSSIPIALKEAEQSGRLNRGARVALVGFGVGYSWAATMVRWV